MLSTIIWFLLTLGILVTFHEFGHFYVARRCGVKVLRFSVGFGKSLYTWRDRQGTEFVLAAIPLGGFVKMLDEREGDVSPDELPQAFSQKSVWQRMAIVAAGPIANFILAIVFYFVLALAGSQDVAPVIGGVADGGLAAKAGFETNDEIVAVDGKSTPTLTAFIDQLIARVGDTGEIKFETKKFTGKQDESELVKIKSIRIDRWLGHEDKPNILKDLGFSLFKPKYEIVEVVSGGAADAADLRAGDQLVSIEKEPIASIKTWVEKIRSNPGETINMVVFRGDQMLDVEITPELETQRWGESFGRVGTVISNKWPEGMVREVNYSLKEAIIYGFTKTWDQAVAILSFLKKLILMDVSVKNMGGAITIAQVADNTAGLGWTYYLVFLASLSVTLGVFNLLPIPVLDGGHLLFYTIEAIKGKPLSEKIQLVGYQIGFFVIVSIMIIAQYNDLVRLFS